MTRFECYLNLYSAICFSSQNGADHDLAWLAEDMNPFWYGTEDSKDIYIYQRFSELWLRFGSIYTSRDENGGLTFGKAFFSELSQQDPRFVAGAKAIAAISQEDWDGICRNNAAMGTYMLTYYLLKKHSEGRALKAIEGMDPFTAEAGNLSQDPRYGQKYMEVYSRQVRPLEIDYNLAQEYVSLLGDPDLLSVFHTITRDEWEKTRADEPIAFRTTAN